MAFDPEQIGVEECDGHDNDGDGQVDEGHADIDGDGVADCVDWECDAVILQGEERGAAFACEAEIEPADDPWALEKMWESPYSEGGCALGTIIFDANGDDVSDVACGSYSEVVVHDGSDGHILYTLPCPIYTNSSSLAIADVDADGTWDLYGVCIERKTDAYVVRWQADGVEVWRSALELGSGAHAEPLSLEIADLEGDGEPEVITNRVILDAATGTVQSRLSDAPDYGFMKRGLAVADITGDGVQEVVSGSKAWRSDGSLAWQVGPASWEGGPQMPNIVSYADIDSPLVFVFSDDGTGVVADAAGQALSSLEIEPTGAPGVTCAGDIDGDGEAEVVQVGEWEVQAFELDGSVLWNVANDDQYGIAGCTTFDFDVDGAKEVVQSNRTSIRILSGANGSTLWEDADWFSNTVHDVPLIADLDGDGSVELIVTNSGGQGYGYPPVRVYRSMNRDLPPGSRIWPSATWSGTSLYADGAVPRIPSKPWMTTRIWRGQPESMITGSDLRVEVAGYCAASCELLDAQVQLSLRLVNGGPEEVHAPVPVAAYTVGEDGSRTLVEVSNFDQHVTVGHASDSVTMRLTTREVLPSLMLVVGDDGSGATVVDDCDQTNNETSWTLSECGS